LLSAFAETHFVDGFPPPPTSIPEVPMLRYSAVLLALVSCTDAPGAPADPPEQGGVKLEEVASGLRAPVHLTAPSGDARLFIVEQPGRIRVIENGRLLAEPFLDITSKVKYGGEQGLLSVAFHPDYARTGYLFVDYTDSDGNTRIERYRVSASDRNRADPVSAKQLLSIDQPFSNHNGGLVAFGPDGKLYIGMGDGGSGGDPQGNGQNPAVLLGKILRVDVDQGEPYGIPAGNPYASGGGRGEIWSIGMRNPWRFSFDSAASLLYVADVGQGAWEEVNVVPAGRAGLDYGWNVAEGNHCYRAASCQRGGTVIPAVEYSHSDGCSVTGGHVYRGTRLPSLVGHYFYADYCEGWVKSFRYDAGEVRDRKDWDFGNVGQILSFGEDSAGELYILSSNGRVYRLAPA
jgi:glucose/arabinose dehydrogenase